MTAAEEPLAVADRAAYRPEFVDSAPWYAWRRTAAAAVIALALVGEFAWMARARDPLAAERAAVAALDDSAKSELARSWERFRELPPDGQRRLRELHAAVESDADPDALRATLAEYQQWKSGLSPVQSAALLNLDPTQRLERVRELTAQQSAVAARTLSDDDARTIVDWLERQVEAAQERLLAALPVEVRKRFEGLDVKQRNWALIMSLVAYRTAAGPGAGPRLENLPPAALAELHDALSPSAQHVWDAAAPDDRKQLLADWIRQAVFRAMPHRDGYASRVDEEKLRAFFDTELTEAERNRYTALPREEMMSQLRRDYLRRKGIWKEPGPGDAPLGRWPYFRPGGGPNDRTFGERGPVERRPGERSPDDRRPGPGPGGPRNPPPPDDKPPPI